MSKLWQKLWHKSYNSKKTWHKDMVEPSKAHEAAGVATSISKAHLT